MELTIIGEWGGFPPAGGATSGFLIKEDNFTLLLECGSGVVSAVQKVCDLGEIDAVLFSHYHFDHYCDLGALLYGRLVKTQLGKINSALPVYAPEDPRLDEFRLKPYAECYGYSEMDKLHIGPFGLSFIKNNHPVDCFAIKIESGNKKIVFTADTAYYNELAEFAANADILISECSFYADMDGSGPGHMNSLDAGTLAQKAAVKELILTHLPHFGEHEILIKQAAEKYLGKITLARQFLKLAI